MRLSVVTDEISEDLAHALEVCEELGIGTVELRSVDGRNIVEHTTESVAAAGRLLASRRVRVCAIASSFLKCDVDADSTDARRPFERSMAIATELAAPLVRAFSYWRVPEPSTVTTRLVTALRSAADAASEAGLRLVIENEYSCNVATGEDAAAIVLACHPADIGVIWDPANEARFDPGRSRGLGGYEHVRDRVAHVHLKDVDESGTWVPIGTGIVEHTALLVALRRDGYAGCLSVETHHTVDGSREAATRGCVEALRACAARAGVELV